MATSTIQIRVDSTLRKEADELFALAGLDMSSAVRLFLRILHRAAERSEKLQIVSSEPPAWFYHFTRRFYHE